ncbi:MAG: DsrE family protein [Nitrospirae bacterium]|nr:DsrE family protein [Nitrospirota bacterium]
MNKKLGILLSTSPDNKNLGIVTGLIQTAIKNSASVYLYLIDDGVECIHDKRLLELSKKGLKLYVCAYGAQKKGIPPAEVATFGGLAVLSELANVCDRFVAFG